MEVVSKKQLPNEIIKKGKFYWHKDSSIKGLHPSYVYKKDDKKNKYNIVCFTSSKGRRRKKLNKNINPNSNDDCYVLNNPQIVKRKSFTHELVGYKVTNHQDKARIKYIANKKK